MKKITALFIAIITVISLSLTSFAASDMKLTGATYPTEITAGSAFSIYGTITSSQNITSVTMSVTNSDGTTQFTYTANPNKKEYNLNNADAKMTFSKLSAGGYTYKVVASDTAQSNVTLLSKSFTVTSASSTLTLSDYTFPTSIEQGSVFSLYGIVTSNYNISFVTIGVYDKESGAEKFSYTGKPGTKEYNIHNVDYLMTFSKLAAGSYIYRITAGDSKTSSKLLLEKNFTVTKIVTAEDGLEKVNWKVIDLSYWNEITSWDKIAENVDAVILRIGYRSTGSGTIGIDKQFENMYKAASARNIPLGCYFFSAAKNVTQAKEEAQFVLDKIKEFGCKFQMPIYFDMETDYQVNMNRSDCTELAKAFCGKIKEAGYYPGIYCNKYFARDEIYASQLREYTFWIAEYNNSCSYDGPYGMWQYSETGKLPGIGEYVDLNECYYDYPGYIKSNGLNGFEPEVSSSFSVKGGAKLDGENKFITNIDPSLTTDNFKSKYLNISDDVTVTFANTVGGKIATGTTVTIKGKKTDFGKFTISVNGDADSNAVINSTDALCVLEHTVGIKTLSAICQKAVELSGDNKINSNDALLILQYAVK